MYEFPRFLPVLLSGFLQKLFPGFPLGISSSNYALGYQGSFTICQLKRRKNRNDDAAGIVLRVSSGISTGVSIGFLKEFHILKCSYGIPLGVSPWTFLRRYLPVLLQECLSYFSLLIMDFILTAFMGCLLEFHYDSVAGMSPSLDFSEVSSIKLFLGFLAVILLQFLEIFLL